MKKIIALLIGLVFVCMPGSAWAATKYTVSKDAAGTMSNVTAYKTMAGQTVWQVNSDGSVSFYVNQINGPSTSGVSQVKSSTSGYFPVYFGEDKLSGTSHIPGASIYATVPSTSLADPVEVGVSAIQKTITGSVYYVDLTGSETLSGNTLYGGFVGNFDSTSEVTATLPTAKKGMSVLFMLTQGQINGCSIFVKFNATDTLLGVTSAWISGSSVIALTGNTLAAFVNLNSWKDAYWWVTGSTGVKYRNQ